MANRLQKLLYFLSAEFLVFILFALTWCIQKNEYFVPAILVILAMTSSALFVFSFKHAKKHLPVMPVKVIEITTDERLLVVNAVSYLLPVGGLIIDECYLPGLIIAIIIIGLLLTFTDYISPHPLLFLFGYHFYKVGVEGASKDYHLVSRKTLRKADDVTSVRRVFEFLLVRDK